MKRRGRILIADDEESFRESTSRLLEHEGFECHCVCDTEEAITCLNQEPFDLVLADIRMPRNPDLRLVREIRGQDQRIPVIIVTGYPSTDTAIRALEMSVAAYLTKPIDFDELLRHVNTAMKRSDNQRRLAAIRNRIQCCLQDLESLEHVTPVEAQEAQKSVTLGTVRTLAGCLSELLEIHDRSLPESERTCTDLCQLLDCPQRPHLREAVEETIDVLHKTKDSFKSKTLGELRLKLERLVKPGKELT
jgi:DNA-binding response OmpR family regulator